MQISGLVLALSRDADEVVRTIGGRLRELERFHVTIGDVVSRDRLATVVEAPSAAASREARAWLESVDGVERAEVVFVGDADGELDPDSADASALADEAEDETC